jgi:CheY-like chemotaxis protein/two-component sensor histidine kinase
MKDEFLAVVSHELRTPLTVILLWARMLRGGAVKAEEHAQVIETIEQSAAAQQQLINDLLDISRSMSGKLRLDVREADIVPIIQAAIDSVRPMADARDVTVKADLDSRAGRVRIDPDRIQQVVWNLVNNAVKFSGKGGRVTVTVRRLDTGLQIQVRDTGQGISADFLPHVFDRFRQADTSTTRAHGGLGLGLAISRQLVELHGGSIRADSAGEGRGATFTVDLPLGDVRLEAAYQPRSVFKTDGVAFRPSAVLRGLHVLLVEDEPGTRTVVQWLLEQCQAQVTAVASAEQALAEFRGTDHERRHDVLVSDIGMPAKDGYALIREIRRVEQEQGRTPAIPAAALTAYAREEERAKARAAGFNAHIPKPVEPEVLVETVAELAGRAKSQSA